MTQQEILCLKQALRAMDRREVQAFERLDDPIPPYSEEFERKMDKLFHAEQKWTWKFIKTPKRRLLSVVFAIIMISVMTVSVSAVGKTVFPFIVTFFKDAIGLELVSSDSPKTILVHYTLDEIPENYVLQEDTRYESSHITEWWYGEEQYISFTQDITENTSIHVSLKEGEYQYTTLRGVEMLYVNSHNTYTFIWQEDGYSFTFLCPDDIPWGDITRMIASIRPEA